MTLRCRAYQHKFMERERAKRGHTAPAQITAINVEADPRQTRLGRGEWDWHAGGGTGDQQFKYDDPVGEHGSISVDLKQNAGGWRLTVSDQGRGLPDNFDIDQRKSFGMQVVKALCGVSTRR